MGKEKASPLVGKEMITLLVVREKRPHETVKNTYFNRKFSERHEQGVGCGSDVGIPVWAALAKSLLTRSLPQVGRGLKMEPGF